MEGEINQFLPGQSFLAASTILYGVAQPTLSVACPADEHSRAGLIRSKTQRAIPSFRNNNAAVSAYNSRGETKAAEQNLN